MSIRPLHTHPSGRRCDEVPSPRATSPELADQANLAAPFHLTAELADIGAAATRETAR